MKRMWTYPLISAALCASDFACESSGKEGSSSASKNDLQVAPEPEQAVQKPEVAADEGREPDERSASADTQENPTEKPSYGGSKDDPAGATAPSPRRNPAAEKPSESSAIQAADSKNGNARKPGSWKKKLEPPDPDTLTPEQRENWRVMQHLRKKVGSYKDIQRERQEYMREIDEMREARKRGEGGSRMGALVAPADSDTNESSDGSK